MSQLKLEDLQAAAALFEETGINGVRIYTSKHVPASEYTYKELVPCIGYLMTRKVTIKKHDTAIKLPDGSIVCHPDLYVQLVNTGFMDGRILVESEGNTL